MVYVGTNTLFSLFESALISVAISAILFWWIGNEKEEERILFSFPNAFFLSFFLSR